MTAWAYDLGHSDDRQCRLFSPPALLPDHLFDFFRGFSTHTSDNDLLVIISSSLDSCHGVGNRLGIVKVLDKLVELVLPYIYLIPTSFLFIGTPLSQVVQTAYPSRLYSLISPRPWVLAFISFAVFPFLFSA